MHLGLYFDSATGETFNKGGKTDILVSHAGKNVFVAECKYWGGIVSLQEALTQLLGYLTWRDSKAALVLFVKNVALETVLNAVHGDVPNHPCFVKSHGTAEDGWYRFEFHIPEDETRPVHLAVLCFHLPPVKKTRKK